mmetsp:Transcript_32991/g.60442  ORF Transcript_32991/g.60442 Transcript_32991/m.60442 type:complete len:288 (+) Transcript_32991:105-968(+)
MPSGGASSQSLQVPTEFRICTIFGIPIFVSLFLVVYYVYELSTRERAVAQNVSHGRLPDYSQAGLIALSCTTSFAVLFGTVLLHEFGHCAGAKMVGGRVERILLWPLGGLAFCSSGGGHWKNLVVAVAGPLTHVPQYAVWWVGHRAAITYTESAFLTDVCIHAMSLQISLAIFNLFVPVYPLDCSRVIMAFCGMCGFSAACTAQFMVLLSVSCMGLIVANMFHWVAVPYLPSGYSPMMLLVLAWLGYQTYQLGASVCRSDISAHPLFKENEENNERRGLMVGRGRDA